MFVSIEGPDGAGKSTVVKGLKELYKNAIFIREPGTTPAGESIRELLLHHSQKLESLSEVLLFYTSFVETSQKVIIPALNEGKLVIADRWFYSTYAYQCYGNNYKELIPVFDSIRKLNLIAVPDLNIIITAPWDTLLKRLSDRTGSDKMESRNYDFKHRVYNYYQQECPGTQINSGFSPEWATIVDVVNLIKNKQ